MGRGKLLGMKGTSARARSKSPTESTRESAARPLGSASAAAVAERRAKLLAFLADPPPEILVAADAVGRAVERYAGDTDRELADIAAGRHPLQVKPASR
jgi:hypothetical protein